MSWKEILKFETKKTLLQRYEDLKIVIIEGIEKFGGTFGSEEEPKTIAGRLASIKKILDGEDYEGTKDELFSQMYKHISKLEDKFYYWSIDESIDLRQSLANLFLAYKRKIIFIKEQE